MGKPADSFRTANVTDVGEAKASSQRDNMTKEYATEEIVVEWEPRLCYHSQNCVRSLPQVFDDSRRPWVKIDAATADEVEAAVALCPSGALRTRRVGARVENRAKPPEVCASANGPLLVSGGVRILDAEGNLLFEGEKVALCRCGGSSNKPFCDGTHKTNGFRG
jgi:uncharacterized Fe-S cluster protein YjdI